MATQQQQRDFLRDTDSVRILFSEYCNTVDDSFHNIQITLDSLMAAWLRDLAWAQQQSQKTLRAHQAMLKRTRRKRRKAIKNLKRYPVSSAKAVSSAKVLEDTNNHEEETSWMIDAMEDDIENLAHLQTATVVVGEGLLHAAKRELLARQDYLHKTRHLMTELRHVVLCIPTLRVSADTASAGTMAVDGPSTETVYHQVTVNRDFRTNALYVMTGEAGLSLMSGDLMNGTVSDWVRTLMRLVHKIARDFRVQYPEYHGLEQYLRAGSPPPTVNNAGQQQPAGNQDLLFGEDQDEDDNGEYDAWDTSSSESAESEGSDDD